MNSRFSIGLMLGILVGVLIAPQSGARSRQVLLDRFVRIRNKIRCHRGCGDNE